MKKPIILITILLISTFCFSQNDPLSLAKRIFARDSFPDIEKYITGEYNGRPNGFDLHEDAKTDLLLLGINKNTAVVNIIISDSLGNELDTYLHFVNDSIWKANAFRGLAMTGFIAQIKDMLENMTEEQIDSTIRQARIDTTSRTLFKSREEYDYELGNCRLILASDNQIINHFKENEHEFNRIKNEIIQELDSNAFYSDKKIDYDLKYKVQINRLFLSSISIGKKDFKGCIEFYIGGMLDNSVGYIYVINNKDLPKMNPNRIIMIREIGNGWYIYKTT